MSRQMRTVLRQISSEAAVLPARFSFEQLLGGRLARLFGRGPQANDCTSLIEDARALLSLRGRASGPALASAFFDRYEACTPEVRRAFLAGLQAEIGTDREMIAEAIAAWTAGPGEETAARLHEATRAPSARLIGMLNLAPGGTRRLLAMRVDLLEALRTNPALRPLDREFDRAFSTWFNAGFLELRRIDWNSPGAVLERLIRYEAVHSLAGWDDLKRRVGAADRRCYAFFHPQMVDDPLIFVEVALTDALPAAIGPILSGDRPTVSPHAASCAIFYSISNCQDGLRGIPFGNFLIKQVVSLLQAELPRLKQFATLSPVPGFAAWLADEPDNAKLPSGDELRCLCARYITTARDRRGQVLDPVARFHLGNGARLEAVHAGADLSEKGMRQSHGLMVNYLYDPATIEANHLRLSEAGEVATSKQVDDLMKPPRSKGRRPDGEEAAGRG